MVSYVRVVPLEGPHIVDPDAVTSVTTSCTHNTSGLICRKLLQVADFFLLGAYRKVTMGIRLVTSPMTSRNCVCDIVVVKLQALKLLLYYEKRFSDKILFNVECCVPLNFVCIEKKMYWFSFIYMIVNCSVWSVVAATYTRFRQA